jgi:ketosteroid isomerase-like protein
VRRADPGADSNADLARQVQATERAFAKTMADRDAAAFERFLSEETIFFSGEEALRGKRRVAERRAKFLEGPEAPFSWEPDHVEVLDSGTLALSTGPVRNARGKLIAAPDGEETIAEWMAHAEEWRTELQSGLRPKVDLQWVDPDTASATRCATPLPKASSSPASRIDPAQRGRAPRCYRGVEEAARSGAARPACPTTCRGSPITDVCPCTSSTRARRCTRCSRARRRGCPRF